MSKKSGLPIRSKLEEYRMRNTTKNTRRATAITLTAALAIAVYLNWQYANTDLAVETDTLTTTTASEDALAVSGTVTDELQTEAEAASSANKNYGEAQLVSVANSTGSEFFEQARLNRQKAHDEALDTIQKSLKGSSLSSEEKAVYTAQLTQNLENINAENEIETLIRAKGFADCLCFLQNGQANLTVMTSGDALTAAQVAQIRDIVLNKCDVTAQNITVVEVK
jgi:stage III sporulation protein AH